MYADVNPKLNYSKNVTNWPNDAGSGSYPLTTKSNKTAKYCGGKSSQALRGIGMENTPVSVRYFSNENTSKIQHYIKQDIFKRSNGEYILHEDQDELDLLLVMRSIFIDYGKNLPCNIKEQVKELNRITIREIVPGMMTNIQQQIGYIKDISQPIQPISLPVNVNNAGRRSLPSVTNIWK